MPPTEEVQYGVGWGGPSSEDLPVPSGAVCRVRKPDPMIIVEAGALDDIDVLTSFVHEKHVTRVKGGKRTKVVEQAPAKDEELIKLMADDTTREKLMSLMDRVTIAAVVKPKVYPVVEDDDRIDGLVYVDTVSFADKAAILRHVVGDVKALERFRQQNQQLGGTAQSS